MKRVTLLVVLLLACSALFAQEADAKKTGRVKQFFGNFKENLFSPQPHRPFSVGAGLELTQNDREDMLPEIIIYSDYELSRYFGMGVRGGLTFASRQPTDRLVSVMEGVFYQRAYLYDFGWIRPFVHTGIGVSVAREEEYKYTDFLGEAALGLRAHYKGWFAEMIFRYGYPFRFAVGLSVGHSYIP
ncbi:MAG: hypothetical protein LBJ31_10705 [Treponema sp.]|jgi:hypothetical protein|nr:hypothetical protein [Treponema sp.]